MSSTNFSAVTGAFWYTGRYIAQKLLDSGREVRTITGHPGRTSPFGDRVNAYPLNFADPAELTRNLSGAATLYNTYWIRFPKGAVSFDAAVENTKTLLNAAKRAGVQRIVHVSITNPSVDSPLGYFNGKAQVEEAIIGSGLAYNIIRPTLVFGAEDVLINNIAWFLRRFPVFAVPGKGDYLVQPVHVEDVAEMAVSANGQGDSTIQDCVGPDTYTYDQLVRIIAATVKSGAWIAQVPPAVAFFLSQLAGLVARDVVLTRAEIDGLMAGLLVSDNPETGTRALEPWLQENRETLGRKYASEMDRHYR
ncbi:MAG: NAD(P)H-binding protein [Chloroflexi bacterium]|nr:NAD(P)H-binding protein [Chloroflexota bacterium]